MVRFHVPNKYLVALPHMYMSKPILIHIQPFSTFGVSGARIFTMDARC